MGSDRAFCAGPIASGHTPTAGLPRQRGRGPMRQVLRRALPTALAGVLLAGCSAEVVVGQASPVPASRSTSPPTPSPSPASATRDRPVRAQRAHRPQRLLGRGLSRVLRRGLHALGERLLLGRLQRHRPGRLPRERHRLRRLPHHPDEVANAYYDPGCDLIAYDRALLDELSTDYGRFLVPVVMAHEFGHAMQGRFGFAENGRSIQDETQADCLAGAWTKWVADGNAEHAALRTPELDDVIRGSCCSVTTSAATLTTARRTGRTSTASPPSTRASTAGSGRAATTSAPIGLHRRDLRQRHRVREPGQRVLRRDRTGWGRRCRSSGPRCSRPPTAATSRPRRRELRRHRAGLRGASRTATWATAPTTPRSTWTRPTWPPRLRRDRRLRAGHREVARPSSTDGAATRSAVCLTGWYEAQWYNGAFTGLTGASISPGHRRGRAVPAGVRRPAEVFPNTSASGFELVGAFRTGSGRRRLRPRALTLPPGGAPALEGEILGHAGPPCGARRPRPGDGRARDRLWCLFADASFADTVARPSPTT